MASRASSRPNNNTLTNLMAPTLLLDMVRNLLLRNSNIPTNIPRLRRQTITLQLSLLTTTMRTTYPASAHRWRPLSSLSPSAGSGIKVPIGHLPRQPLTLRIMPRVLPLYHLLRRLNRILKPVCRLHKSRNRSRTTGQIHRVHKARRSQRGSS